MKKIVWTIICILILSVTAIATTQKIYEDMDLQSHKISSILAIYLTDTATNLYKDASGNMNFVDTVTGGKTLAQLITGTPITMSGTPDYITLSGQNIVRGTVDVSDDTNLAVTAPMVLTGDTLSIPVATSSVDGYLDNADWTTFNNKD